MKNVILLIVALLALNVHGQKKINKELAYQGEIVEAEFDFASSIEIVSWDKPSVKVEIEAWTEDEKYTELFTLNVREGNGRIEMSSTGKEVFKAYQRDHELSTRSIRTNSIDHEFKYTLYVPKNVVLELSTINGNIHSEYVEGEITANLINGAIEIDRYKGNLRLESINGIIKLPGKDSSIKAKTITGSITTNPSLAVKHKDRFIGEEIELLRTNSSNSLDLHTVNGKIILN